MLLLHVLLQIADSLPFSASYLIKKSSKHENVLEWWRNIAKVTFCVLSSSLQLVIVSTIEKKNIAVVLLAPNEWTWQWHSRVSWMYLNGTRLGSYHNICSRLSANVLFKCNQYKYLIKFVLNSSSRLLLLSAATF